MPFITSKAGGAGGIPNPITTTVNISPTDDARALLINAGPGSSVEQADMATVKDEFGATLFNVDAGGGVSIARGGATPMVGFFNNQPVAQPAVPVTLGDVIAALQALGLVAT